MAILKNKLYGKFTQVPNKLILDSQGMNDKVFRILIYLMSKPDQWKVNNADIMRRHEIKTRGTMGKYWKEMINTGWISRTPARKKTGTFGGYDYEIHSYPCPPQPCTVQADTDENHVRSDDTHSKTGVNSNTDINNSSNTDFEIPSTNDIIDYLVSKKKMPRIKAVGMAEAIHKYYEKNDWTVGKGEDKQKMQNWKLAVSGWFNRTYEPVKKDEKVPKYEDKGVHI